MSDSSRKPRSRELAALALAGGKTIAEAAKAAGDLAERTVYNWLADPAFVARVRQIQAEMVGRAVGELSDGMVEAARVLRQLLASVKEEIRLRAADRLLSQGLQAVELQALQKRVEDIEAKLKELQT